MTAPAQPLTFIQRLGYGAGDFGFNLFYTTATLYLLYYYTDVLGLPPATAGWVFAVALIWDALFDPLMGYLANRTRSRWGRYRPYLLFGAVPLAASWVLMFVPTGLEGTALVLFAMAAHMLFRTLYAVVSMPFLALSASMTSDSTERGVLAGYRMVAAAGCGLVVAFSTLKLVEVFGGGQAGFLWTAIAYAVVATLFFFLTFATTRETIDPADEGRGPGAGEMWAMLRSNSAFWVVSAAMLAGLIGGTVFGKTLPYHIKYGLGREDLIGPALTALTLATLVSIPLWTMLMKRTSKRTIWACGIAIGLATYPVLWLMADEADSFIALLAVLGFGAGAGYLGFWGMMPDTVEYGEWRSGVKAEGAVFGLVSLILKASLAFAAAGVGETLGAIGYRAGEVQSAETLAGIKLMLVAGPALCGLVALGFILFYPLDPRTHGRLVRALAWRKARKVVRPGVGAPGR